MLSPLRQKRIILEKTIWNISASSNISQSRISLIERGRGTPNREEKERLAKALNCKEEEIFPCEK